MNVLYIIYADVLPWMKIDLTHLYFSLDVAETLPPKTHWWLIMDLFWPKSKKFEENFDLIWNIDLAVTLMFWKLDEQT